MKDVGMCGHIQACMYIYVYVYVYVYRGTCQNIRV